jgi:hypothetical protein
VSGVPTRSDLEALSSRELHDLAVRRALHHADVGFLWELLRAIPAAEAIEGHPERTGEDMYRISALVSDALESGEGETADALRPLYIDYLTKHGVSAGPQSPPDQAASSGQAATPGPEAPAGPPAS